MTSSIAFTFTTSAFYYFVLTGSKSAPTFVTKGRIILPANHNIPETVSWFEKELSSLLTQTNPTSVGYKLTITNVTNSYVSSVYYGQAVLNLLCHNRGIDVKHVSPNAIVATKFNLPKQTDLQSYIEGLIGRHPPYWDKAMKDTALIALLKLN